MVFLLKGRQNEKSTFLIMLINKNVHSIMPESLKNKTIKGVGWSAIDNISSYAVTFLVGLILARLLTPDDYGLIGIISIFTAVCGCYVTDGFSRRFNTYGS